MGNYQWSDMSGTAMDTKSGKTYSVVHMVITAATFLFLGSFLAAGSPGPFA